MSTTINNDSMDLEMTDKDAGDTPSVSCAARVAFFGSAASYLERLGQDELIAAVASTRQATIKHVKSLESQIGLKQYPLGAKELRDFSLIDARIRELQQELGPHLPFGNDHTVHQKPFSAFEEQPLARTSHIVQEANPFTHLQRPMLRPANVRLAGMANEKNPYVRALCSFPVLETVCCNVTAEGLMGLALSCTQIASTLKLDDPASLGRWRANLLLVYPPMPSRRGPRRSAAMAGLERLREQLPYL